MIYSNDIIYVSVAFGHLEVYFKDKNMKKKVPYFSYFIHGDTYFHNNHEHLVPMLLICTSFANRKRLFNKLQIQTTVDLTDLALRYDDEMVRNVCKIIIAPIFFLNIIRVLHKTKKNIKKN